MERYVNTHSCAKPLAVDGLKYSELREQPDEFAWFVDGTEAQPAAFRKGFQSTIQVEHVKALVQLLGNPGKEFGPKSLVDAASEAAAHQQLNRIRQQLGAHGQFVRKNGRWRFVPGEATYCLIFWQEEPSCRADTASRPQREEPKRAARVATGAPGRSILDAYARAREKDRELSIRPKRLREGPVRVDVREANAGEAYASVVVEVANTSERQVIVDTFTLREKSRTVSTRPFVGLSRRNAPGWLSLAPGEVQRVELRFTAERGAKAR